MPLLRLKIIERALLKELTVTFLMSLLSLNFFLLMEKVLRLSRLLSGVGASLADMARILFYIQPQLMLLTIPMSLLLSALLTYGRMNADSELTALRAAGMPFRDICRPLFVLGTGCFLFGLLISFSISPLSASKLRDALIKIIMQRAPLAIEAGIFNTSFKDIVILVRDKPEPDRMRGIFIYDRRDKKEPKALTAREGRIYADSENNLSLFLKDGFVHIAKGEGSLEIFFEGYKLSLNLMAEGPMRKNAEMTPGELLREAAGKDRRDRISLLLEFHRRLSLPVLCFFLMFLGPPLALISGKSGRLGGLTIGLAVFTVFYIILVYAENTVRSGILPHYVGAWIPIALLGACSLWAFRKAGSR
ncbi:MAG TPA: LptF/LptG family permease [Thermodesulfovibrionales bacterium]|nr:LptF/LptG family permease [Thermodesulfovibrionales bacterium]